MTPFEDKDEQYYQQNAFLRTKVTKRKVLPNRVTYEMKSDGKSVNAAKFFFLKTTSSTEPLISPNE